MSSRFILPLRCTLIAAAVLSCLAPLSARSNPTGPAVVNGTATIVPTGSVLQVTNTPNAIINWQSFSIGAGEITRFVQQSAASTVLNRVTTRNPSEIFGTLQSNGRVFLINPGGILFGPGSQVDVAGLVASSLRLSDADFLEGRLRFTQTPRAGAVVNLGGISTQQGGQVYLVGPAVTNGGIITGPRGEVLLAAGNAVELVDPGTPNLRVEIAAPRNRAVNVGEIVAEAGRIGIHAGLIRNSGQLRADSVQFGDHGEILLRATRDVTLDSTSLVSSSTPGGREPETVVDIQAGRNIKANGDIDGGNGMVNLNAGGHIELSTAAGAAGIVNANYVNLDAAGRGNAITQGADGRIFARRIFDVAANGDVTLPGGNGVNFLYAKAGGDLTFRNIMLFPTVRSIELTRGGKLDLDYSAFDLMIAGDVLARRIRITNDLSGITVNGFAGATIGAPGPIDISAAGAVTVQGTNINVNSPAVIASSRRVTISAGGDLLVAGGPQPGNYALISSRSVDLTVGGTLRLNQGTGENATARIQTTTSRSPIRVHFTNLPSGGYFVNDVEGVVADGENGFFTGLEPAIPGSTLLLDYATP